MPIPWRASGNDRSPSPVHSARVGQEAEVHYRWHPYFGHGVLVRRIEQRATGQFLSVQGPAGVVTSIAGWMLDPLLCAGMMLGSPRVDIAALIDLQRLLMGATDSSHSGSDVVVVPETGNGTSEIAVKDIGSADKLSVRRQQVGRIEQSRSGQGHITAGSDPDASRRSSRRGAR